MWALIIFLSLAERLEIIHPISAPVIISSNVLSFSINGRFVFMLNVGRDHSIAAPVITDNVAMMIIGLITMMFSDMDECGLCKRGPHTVTIENRIE